MGQIQQILRQGHRVRRGIVSSRKVRNLILRGEWYPGSHPNSAAVDRAQQDRALAATAETRGILRGIIESESQKRYPPLKSVAEDLYFVLDNCEVWPPSRKSNLQCLLPFQQTEVNQRAIQSLAPRVKKLFESLRESIDQGDQKEEDRTDALEL